MVEALPPLLVALDLLRPRESLRRRDGERVQPSDPASPDEHGLELVETGWKAEVLQRGLDLSLGQVGSLDLGPRQLGLLLRVDGRRLGDGEGDEAGEDVRPDELGDLRRAVRVLDRDGLGRGELLDRWEGGLGGQDRVVDEVVVLDGRGATLRD